MRRFLTRLGLFVGGACLIGTPAWAQFYQQHASPYPAPAGSINKLSSGASGFNGKLSGGVVSVPAAPAKQPAAPTSSTSAQPQQTAHIVHHSHHAPRASIFLYPVGSGYPFIWTGAYTPAFVPFGYPYIYAPSVSVPRAAPAPVPADPPKPAPAPADQPPPGKPKATNAEQKAKAGKVLGYGDAQFAKQKFLAASERYKMAAQLAPDLAEPYLRQGCTQVATAQYDSAAKAFRRALRIRSDWAVPPFNLDQLYAGPIAKTAHLENLAKAVEANPLDSELLIVLGMELFLDRQPERAGVFFSRAAQLGANEEGLLNDLLPNPAQPGEKKERPGGKVVF